MGVPEKALIAADEIVEYIPQRPPIVMADAFYGIGEDGCAAQRADRMRRQHLRRRGRAQRVRPRSSNIAQSAALRAGYMDRTPRPRRCGWGTSAP